MRLFQRYALEISSGSKLLYVTDNQFRDDFVDELTLSLWYRKMGWGGSDTDYGYLFDFSSNWLDSNDDGKADTTNRVAFKVTKNEIAFHWGLFGYTYTSMLPYKYDDKWHHYVVVMSGNKMTMYVDAEKFAERVLSDKFVGFDFSSAGMSISSYGSYSIGKIGEIRIYNRALREQEVKYLYRGGHIVDGLRFWQIFDEDTVLIEDGIVKEVYDKIYGIRGVAYGTVRLTDGKDIDVGAPFVLVKKV